MHTVLFNIKEEPLCGIKENVCFFNLITSEYVMMSLHAGIRSTD
jgi:hypothetical protein